MCGRFVFLSDRDREDILTQMPPSLAQAPGTEQLETRRGDIYPSQKAPVFVETDHGPEMAMLKWGYENPFKPKQLLINARAETAADKRMFKDDFRQRRCLIPATGFYEWDPEKRQFVFNGPEDLLYLGGLWQPDRKTGDDRFVILTKDPDETVSRVHNRMPVLIQADRTAEWLADHVSASPLIGDYSVPLHSKLAAGQQSFLQ